MEREREREREGERERKRDDMMICLTTLLTISDILDLWYIML